MAFVQVKKMMRNYSYAVVKKANETLTKTLVSKLCWRLGTQGNVNY